MAEVVGMVAVAAHTSAAEECAAAAAVPISAVGCAVAVRISVVVAVVYDTTAVAAGGTSVAGPQDRDILRGRFPVAIVQWPSAMHPAI